MLALILIFFSSVVAIASPETDSVVGDYRQFAKMTDRVLHEEPTLYDNPNFDQKFTLKYQRYAGSQEVTLMKIIFSVPPKSVRLEQLAKAYEKYAREATSLAEELPSFVQNHISMISDKTYAQDYRRRYEAVGKSIFPTEQGKLREFKVFDCDYTTQPTDAFWYVWHAQELLDRYGSALFGEEWVKKRDGLHAASRLKGISENRLMFEQGIKQLLVGAPESDSTEDHAGTKTNSAD